MEQAPASTLDLFTQTCSSTSDLNRIRKEAIASGWQDFVPSRQSGVGKLLDIGRAATADQRMSFQSLRRDFGGEELVLILVRVEVDKAWVNGCRLYGTNMDVAPTQDQISRRLGREPTEAGVDKGVAKANWEPGLTESDDSIELYLAPPASEMAQVTGFAGWALVAQAVGIEG